LEQNLLKGRQVIGFIAVAILLIAVLTFVIYVQIATTTQPEKKLTPAGVSAGQPFGLGETLVAVTPIGQPSTPMPGLATMLLKFGEPGSSAGQFTNARAVAVDPQGRIFIGEAGSGRVQIFDPTGKVQTEWKTGSQDSALQAIAVDPLTGSLFVSESGILFRFVRPLVGEMAFRPLEGVVRGSIADIDAGLDGSLLAAYNGDNLVLVDKNNHLLLDLAHPMQTITGHAENELRVALDNSQNIYVLGKSNRAVLKYSASGKFLMRIGAAGNGPGQFRAPSDVSADSQGRVYVADGARVLILSSSGKYQGEIGVESEIYDLATDVQDQLYVLTAGSKVYQFNVAVKP
jgi:DNA-binding beta-propeller fold protein YncE